MFCITLGNNNKTIKMRTGLTMMDFHKLLSDVPALELQFQSANKASDALFYVSNEMRTGASDDSILTLDEAHWREKLKLYCIEILVRDFVPNSINYSRSRQDIQSHCSTLSKSLFCESDENAITLIWDGTYIYIEKSHSHKFQKDSYPSHKKRNYLKPMMVVATDGTIIAVIGPFKATDNDASIAKQILERGHPALANLTTGDVAILDRGFRNCIHEFQSRGFIVKTPACEPVGKQLTTIDANRSRLMTKVRYDVERINGMIKNVFRIFSIVWESQWVPHLMTDIEIAAGLLNKYIIKPNEDRTKSKQTATEMLQRIPLENVLGKVINGKHFKSHLTKNEVCTDLEALDIFPALSLDDLRDIAFGIYQIEQAKLYGWDYLQVNNNNFSVKYFSDEIIENYFSSQISHLK